MYQRLQEGCHTYRAGAFDQGCISAASIDDLLVLHKDDFDRDALLAQLKLLHSNYTISSENASVHDLVTLVQGFLSAENAMVSQVVKLIHLFLVMPDTNLISERSFSSMRELKLIYGSLCHGSD